MGGISAMNSLSRVIETHGDELVSEYMNMVPENIREHIETVYLTNSTYNIEVEWVFKNGGSLPGPSIDIDMLAEQFPDCKVGY